MSEEKKQSNYGAEQVKVLEGLEAVRERPGMYIGSTAEEGLHHLIWEIVDNSVDEHLAGNCDNITVKIDKDNGITVTDNGRGIPVENHPEYGKSVLEIVLTVLHAGGKFGGNTGYKVSGGLHGVGASVVNALSSHFQAFVRRDNKVYRMCFEKGDVVEDIQVIEKNTSQQTGTSIYFQPDPTIFKTTTTFDVKKIYRRMQESAFLNPGLTFELVDEREVGEDGTPLQEIFCYQNGLYDYIQHLNRQREVLHDEVFFVREEVEGVQVEVAMQYQSGYGKDDSYFYANNVKTPGGGTHAKGWRRGLTETMKKYMEDNQMVKGKQIPEGEDMRVGLTAVVSVKLPNPEFEGQTKEKLGNDEVTSYVNKVMKTAFSRFLAENPKEANVIVRKILDSFEERMAARKAREDHKKRKSEGKRNALSLPDKLAECSSKDRKEREIFLVEGDSAGGSAKQARNRVTQAILPLRGKVLNAEKAKRDKINANKEIAAITSTLGTDLDEYFDYDKREYDKVIIMCDADVDGRHIAILLLTLFYRKMKLLVERGHVYMAKPPLYGLKEKNKVVKYVYSEEELEEARLEFPKAKTQRYKGLGEMDSKQLKDTTMDPNKRALIQVTADDAEKADGIFQTFMGDDASLRFDYIEKYGHKADVDA